MTIDAPLQGAAQQVTDAWTALRSWMPVPGMGAIPINAFVLRDDEPMRVDTGLGALSDEFLERLWIEIGPAEPRWIWLSHTDADHIRQSRPRAQGRAERPRDHELPRRRKDGHDGQGRSGPPAPAGARRGAGDRPPPAAPDKAALLRRAETMGFFDATDRVFFAADAFGALHPGATECIDDVPAETLRDGLVGWSSVDAPWLAHMDRRTDGRDRHRLRPGHHRSRDRRDDRPCRGCSRR